MKNTIFPHKFWRPFLDFMPQLFFRPKYVWFPVHLKSSMIPDPSGQLAELIVMPPPLGARGIMFSGCPSVRPSEAWNTLFWPVHRSVGPPDQPFYGMSVRPSVRPERFPGICRRLHGGISLKFYMLMYLDHLHNWLVYGHGLVFF